MFRSGRPRRVWLSPWVDKPAPRFYGVVSWFKPLRVVAQPDRPELVASPPHAACLRVHFDHMLFFCLANGPGRERPPAWKSSQSSLPEYLWPAQQFPHLISSKSFGNSWGKSLTNVTRDFAQRPHLCEQTDLQGRTTSSSGACLCVSVKPAYTPRCLRRKTSKDLRKQSACDSFSPCHL